MKPCDDGGEAGGWGQRSRGVPSKGYSLWEVGSEVNALQTDSLPTEPPWKHQV